jgi:hypothetical protein
MKVAHPLVHICPTPLNKEGENIHRFHPDEKKSWLRLLRFWGLKGHWRLQIKGDLSLTMGFADVADHDSLPVWFLYALRRDSRLYSHRYTFAHIAKNPFGPFYYLHEARVVLRTCFKDLKIGVSNVQVVVTVNNNLISVTKEMEGNDYVLDRIGQGQRGSELERCTGKSKK